MLINACYTKGNYISYDSGNYFFPKLMLHVFSKYYALQNKEYIKEKSIKSQQRKDWRINDKVPRFK